MEGDRRGISEGDKKWNFYPRPHMEGDRERYRLSRSLRYFYPRPHMEGDAENFSKIDEAAIFTHALTWRATAMASLIQWFSDLFLPTPSHGGRRYRCGDKFAKHLISTHALTWRATAIFKELLNLTEDFYPRPHMEGDGRERMSVK